MFTDATSPPPSYNGLQVQAMRVEETEKVTTTPILLIRKRVSELTGISKSHLYWMMRNADFPEPLKLSPRVVRWVEQEVVEWIERRPRASGDVGKAQD